MAARFWHGATRFVAAPGASAGGKAEWTTPKAAARHDLGLESASLKFARRRAGLLGAALRAAIASDGWAEARRLLVVLRAAEGAGSVWAPYLEDPGLAEMFGLVQAAQEKGAHAGRAARRRAAGAMAPVVFRPVGSSGQAPSQVVALPRRHSDEHTG